MSRERPTWSYPATNIDLYELEERLDLVLTAICAAVTRLETTLQQTTTLRDQQLQKGGYKCLSKLKRKSK